MSKNPRKYYCRFCDKEFDTLYMASICFQLDIKLLQNDKHNNAIPASKNKPGKVLIQTWF